ncbi:hypothetical protein K501DRAFT_332998, partial [Backusella circina FSU 941]
MFQDNSTVFTPTRLLMNDWAFNQDFSTNDIGLFNPYPVKQPETVIPANTQDKVFEQATPYPTTPPTPPACLPLESPKIQKHQVVEKKKERKKVLERNRQAAYKCRQKKKQWLQNLESTYEVAEAKNKDLTTLVAQLREESIYLRNILLTHGNCDCSVVQAYLRRTSEQLAISPPFASSSSSETSLSTQSQAF